MNIWQYAVLSTLLLLIGAGVAAYLVKNPNRNVLQSMLSFSGAFLFGVLILELMPEVFSVHNKLPGLFFILGFFLQTGMDYWTSGIEHGHMHVPKIPRAGFVFSLFFGLSIHAIMDGLPFAGVAVDGHQHDSVFLAILLHKLVEGFTIFIVLGMMNFSINKSWMFIGLFSLITPIGMLVFDSIESLHDHFQYVLAFAGGSLLHVSVTILFEAENIHHHGMPVGKLISILLGLALAIGITIN